MWTIVTELHISMILFLISRQHIGSVRYPQQHVFREHMGRIGATGRHSYNLRHDRAWLPELNLWCRPNYHHRLIWGNFVANERGRWDPLAGTGPVSRIQDGDPVCHCTGISVRADPLQDTGRGPMVEGQLLGAVATHPDPNGSQQHSHTRHGLLRRRRHGHIMVGLRLKEK